MCMKLADQLLVSSSSFLLTSVSYFRLSHHQVVRPTSLYFPSAKTQSRRYWRTFKNCRCHLCPWFWDDGSPVSWWHRDELWSELMNLSFGNWAVQRCLEAASTAEERRKIVSCMRQGRQLTPSCLSWHLTGAVSLTWPLIVMAATFSKRLSIARKIFVFSSFRNSFLVIQPKPWLINMHRTSGARLASSAYLRYAPAYFYQIMELSWTPPAPPIFA